MERKMLQWAEMPAVGQNLAEKENINNKKYQL